MSSISFELKVAKENNKDIYKMKVIFEDKFDFDDWTSDPHSGNALIDALNSWGRDKQIKGSFKPFSVKVSVLFEM